MAGKLAGKFKTIVIDPPWHGPNASPAFQAHAPLRVLPYSTMTGIAIASLQVPQLAHPKAQLWIWAGSRGLGDAQLLLQQWSFNYRALFVWDKSGRKNGKWRIGTGRHMRGQCEFLLWGGRPGAQMVRPSDCPSQLQEWPVPRRHSEKPGEAYQLIRSMSAAPRVDLFARQRRPGFQSWGNELAAQG